MNEHVTAKLSAYLDDELEPRERQAVDGHLEHCAACAGELDALRRIVGFAATVPEHDTVPARDLWTGIRARIEPHGNVASFEGARAAAPHTAARATARRVSFSIAQLAAAAALLIAVSATAAWMLRGREADAPSPAAAVIEAEVEPTVPATEVRPANFADAQYDAAVTDLERVLQERRNDLNPRTVEILERNLKLIDAAIAQSRQALEEDPGNMYLTRHLVESRRRKLELLRRATFITEGD
jgi:anti-sigma factor RsiW